ncbi:uncharacterized protein V6R79_010181 [Siganus canaliculatus]
MAGGQGWITLLKKQFEKSPLWPNIIFSFVLLGLEKLVEVEFVCPCDPKRNGHLVAAYFAVPAVVVFLLMMMIQGCKTDCCGRTEDSFSNCSLEKFKLTVKAIFCNCSWEKFKLTVKAICSFIIPSFVWLIVMFLDGRYLVCAKTDWPGRFVVVAEAVPQKWCKPINQTSSEELMKKSQKFASDSQWIGVWLICALPVTLLFTTCCKGRDKEEQGQITGSSGREEYQIYKMADVEDEDAGDVQLENITKK